MELQVWRYGFCCQYNIKKTSSKLKQEKHQRFHRSVCNYSIDNYWSVIQQILKGEGTCCSLLFFLNIHWKMNNYCEYIISLMRRLTSSSCWNSEIYNKSCFKYTCLSMSALLMFFGLFFFFMVKTGRCCPEYMGRLQYCFWTTYENISW